MALLNDIYIVCAAGGFIYLVGTAFLGFANADSGGDGGDGGDAGGIDAGDTGGDAGGIDAGDTGGGDAGGIDAGDTGGGDMGDFSGVDVGDIRHLHHASRATGLAHVGNTNVQRRRKVHLGLLLLKMTSPYTVACFSFFFGLIGLLAMRYMEPLGLITLLPATIAGVVGYRAMTAMMNSVADKLYASSTHKEEDVIGTVAELCTPIAPGRVSEIIYLTGQTRHTAPAKGKDPTQSIAKTTKVIITDIVDGVFVVEPYTDIVLDDSLTIESQKLRNS